MESMEKITLETQVLSKNDILNLIIDYGMLGYGVFWRLVEKMRENGGRCNHSDMRLWAYEMHVAENIVKDVLQKYNLFLTYEDNTTEFQAYLLETAVF